MAGTADSNSNNNNPLWTNGGGGGGSGGIGIDLRSFRHGGTQPLGLDLKGSTAVAARGGLMGEKGVCSGCNKVAPADGAGAGDSSGVSSSSKESFVVEEHGEISGNGGNGNGGMKPAWNKPSNVNAVETSPLMGTESVPALSESMKASPKSTSFDQSTSSSPANVTASSSSPQKSASGNANEGPSVQNCLKGKEVESGLGNSCVGEGSHGSSFRMTGNEVGVDAAGRDRAHDVHNNANKETGERNSDDYRHQRTSYRGGNGGQHSRRDQYRGNSGWNYQRNFNCGYSYMQSQRSLPRAMRPLQAPPFVPAPVMSAPFRFPPPCPDYHHMHFPSQVLHGPPPRVFIQQPYSLSEKIMHQIDYYFSYENLVKDEYLRRQMDEHGWVPILTIANFNKVKELTDNIQFILNSVRSSSVVEVQNDRIRRREAWEKWILPVNFPEKRV